MGRGVDIPWVGGRYTMGKEGQNTNGWQFFFFHLMATVNWLTILPLFGCAH